MDYIYGKLNFEVQKVEYEGASTSTTQTTVDNEARTVSVDVLKLPPANLPDNVVYLDLNNLVPLDNLPKTYNTDFTIKSTIDATQEHDAFDSNNLILESSVWEIQSTSEPTYVASSSPFSSATLALQDLAFSADGLKVFVIESTTDRIHQHSLSTAFDVNTINITPTTSRVLLESNPYGLFFKPDGSAFYYLGSGTRMLSQVTLSTPWDLSTAGVESSSSALKSGTYQSFVISPDGLKIYILNSTTDTIQIYNLETAWVASSLNTTAIASISVVLEESSPTGLYISPDGLKAFVVGSSSDRVFEYDFDSAWGNQLTYTGRSVATQQNVTNDLTFRPDGLAMFLIGSTTKCVDAYSIPFAFSLASDIGIAKETKEKFKIKTKATQDEVNSKLEITYNKDNESASSIIEITKEGHISKGTIPFASVNNRPTTTQGYGITNANINIIPITWEALKTLRDNSLLKPGQQYRITDFVTTTAQSNTQSAGHAFDLIVVADSTNKLNEQARAIQHAEDTYFANSKLEAWQVWYSLDNDTNRFAWADDEGKGVIYRLIDEFNNDCPYDFKNIQFIRKLTNGALDLVDGVDTWVYTFTGFSSENNTLVDGTTLKASEYFTDEGSNLYKNNIIGIYEVRRMEEDGFDNILETLSNNVFIGRYDEVPYVEDGPSKLVYFSFNNNLGRDCHSNTFGYYCYSNTFGNNVYNNTFGNSCSNNTFGNNVSYNTFGNYYGNNIFGNSFSGNSFGNNFSNNTFGNGFSNNTFGNDVSDNTFDNGVSYNTFGNNVWYNIFGNGVSNNSFGNYFMYNTVKSYVQYVRTPDTVNPNAFQYATLENGLVGASVANRLNLEGIQAVVGYNTPIKVTRGTGAEIVAVWQNGIALAGLRKATPTTVDWTDL